MRTFLQWWGEFVAVERHPARAARLRELEAAAESAFDQATLRAALAGIREILEAASQEVEELTSR